MMKKILFVIDSLGCGGAEKSLVSLLPLLSREKYEIHLWILHRGGAFEDLLPDSIFIESQPSYSSVETLELKLAQVCYSVWFRLLKVLGMNEHHAETLWKCIGKYYKVIEGEFDVAVAYQQGFPTYVVARKIKAAKKIAWINADIFAAGYNPVYNAQFYRLYDYIVPVGEKLKTILRNNYPAFHDKFECVYDVLNPDVIRQQSVQSSVNHHLWGHGVTIVTVGRLALPKNHILAVETAKILRDRGIDFKWFFVGEGSERQHIESLIETYGLQQNVLLLGMRMNPYPYVANCTIYVQTSSFEGYGLTIAEAKILGKSVVSTNFDVVYDQLKHEYNGLIAEMTPESVADNILRLINDTNLRNRIIANVNKEKNTTYKTEIEKVEKLFDAD